MGCSLVSCETLFDELDAKDQALLAQPRNLRQLNLNGADMRHAQLVHADLSESSLVGADLGGNDLSAAQAVGACFDQANLSHANLGWSVLRGSSMRSVNFYRCNLFQADLRGVDLGDSDLTEANLGNVHLMGTRLTDAQGLKPELIEVAACWSERTQWPAGWQLPVPVRTCEKHGASRFSRKQAVQGLQITDETKLLMRKESHSAPSLPVEQLKPEQKPIR